MSTGSSDIHSRGHGRSESPECPAQEWSEVAVSLDWTSKGSKSRTLLATIPAAAVATVNGSPIAPMNLTSLP